MKLTRRQFLQSATAAAVAPSIAAKTSPGAFSFVLLGDLHYDKLEHHDMAWLEKNHPGDLSQIQNYSRITAGITPALFDSVRGSVVESSAALVLQVGDFVEGLCGSAELSARQNTEAIEFVKGKKLGVPFLFTKGNHDVTGDGAVEAFKEVFHPFIDAQTAGFSTAGARAGACYAIQHEDALFCFFDAYDKASLEWLEAALASRTAGHCFVIIHPPVVPYGARATWNLYSSEKDKPRRDKLLSMLGSQRALVLGGHIHRFNTISRVTPGGGRFAQFALSSIVNAAEVKPDTVLSGVENYNGDQINVEPRHSPDTAEARRAVFATEAPFVKDFEYADLPGHAVITVDGGKITATMHSGISREPWRTVDLGALLG